MNKLKPYKIKINSPNESEMVQKFAFELGYKWCSGKENNNKVLYTDKPFLVLYDFSCIMWIDKLVSFKAHKNEEISVTDFLLVKPIKWTSKDVAEYLMDFLLHNSKKALDECHSRSELPFKCSQITWLNAIKIILDKNWLYYYDEQKEIIKLEYPF